MKNSLTELSVTNTITLRGSPVRAVRENLEKVKTMNKDFDLQEYMSAGVERVVKEAAKATFSNPRESVFMGRFALAAAKATKKRKASENDGLHVPPFLIASITSSCNLHCAGCYSRANHATVDCQPAEQLTGEEWLRIFREAEDLGISFILLAGGEPMLRRDIIESAGKIPNIVFPIFTNGTFVDERYFALLDKCRNLIPVVSIEGDREETDSRRGDGIYDRSIANMEEFNARGLVYGVSVTVTKENMHNVVSDGFIDSLASRGCKAVFYIEFVPVTEEAKSLAPDDDDRQFMKDSIDRLRGGRDDIMFISFPGDEKSSGGCLAAGRGFFHINSHGGAEPCPFSAFSDINVKDTSLKEALGSGLFSALRDGHVLEEDHAGGCVLFERKDQVEAIMGSLKAGK